jgi:hypothetical protein
VRSSLSSAVLNEAEQESSLGAGGLATPWYANATAAAGYCFMFAMSLCGGLLISKIGMRLALLVGLFPHVAVVIYTDSDESRVDFFNGRYHVITHLSLIEINNFLY